ncbi:Imm43 family immunity protein [Cohnella terricola]|nr:Imm43 family immunity protein [Cohnella terricola]
MMKQKIYAMVKKSGKGVPMSLNAVLAEEFNDNNPMPDMNYEWTISHGTEKVRFPEHLFLVCKEKILSFDFYADFDGYIVSDDFLRIFLKYMLIDDYQMIPLETLSWKGTQITDKKYHYLVPNKKETWIDYNHSKYDVDEGKTKEQVISRDGAFVRKFEEIILKESEVDKEVFVLKGSLLTRFLFCSEIFKNEIEKEHLVGVDFIPIEELPAYYNKKYFL